MNEEPIAFTPPEPSDLSDLLDGYEVNSLIAKGGMGAVYHATQLSLDREVAIKLLPEELCDPAFREQFREEARAMAKLNHPNLIGIFDYGDAQGMPYIVMEYVAGQSLYYSSYGKVIDQQVAVEIVIGICRGLGVAHDFGVVHRDIKPANILLDASAKPKIGDFGLASSAGGDGDDEVIYGTPGYAAPEIYHDASAVGVASDLFAVGVVLYELLTGRLPENPASSPSSISKCDPRIDPIFKKATSQNPALRHQNANELADELEEILPTLGNGRRRVIKTALDQSQSPKVVLKRRSIADGQAKPLNQQVINQAAGELGQASGIASTLPPATVSDGERESEFPEAPVPVPTQPLRPVSVPVKTSSQWPMIRNLSIAASLILVLIFAWGSLQTEKKEVLAEQDVQGLEQRNIETEPVAENKVARESQVEKARHAQLEKERMSVAALETAKSSLERLGEFREKLYQGQRDRFPNGTIDRGTHAFFLVDQPMTWSEASEFAEQHGGHLATPSAQADLDVLVKHMEGECRQVWIGGGTTGLADWGWVNGDRWTYRKPGTTLGSCAALTDASIIKARPNGEKNFFVIQWSKDGRNLGAMAAQLARLAATRDTPSPSWPPSTVFNENRSFLLVSRVVSWQEADLFAANAGGHLAVVSKVVEGIFIRDYLKKALPPQEAAWLGGHLVDGDWTWTTAEPWSKSSWLPNSPDGQGEQSALRYQDTGEVGGWDDAEPNAGNAQSFLIEWSPDAAVK